MDKILNNDFEILGKINCFFDSQIKQVKIGGPAVLLRKIGRLLVLVIRLILAMPSSLVIFLLRPFRLVRFFKLDSERIGHFASLPEIYFYGRSNGSHSKKKFDVFYHGSKICNLQLQKMMRRKVYVFPIVMLSWYLDSIVFLLRKCFPDGKRHEIVWKEDIPNITSDMYRLSPYLDFSKEERSFAEEELQKIGIPSGSQYICIYGRDSAYLNKTIPEGAWSHHDIRDNDIENFLSMAELMTSKGYYVVRMGKIAEKPLKTSNPMILDYAMQEHHSDFLDIYLPGNCRFFLGVPGGLVAIPALFRKPIGYVDMINLFNLFSWDINGIFITKKMWLCNEKRLLNFREMISLQKQVEIANLVQKGTIEIVDNNPEEIKALGLEIDQRIEGLWQDRDEDEVLQNRLKALFNVESVQNSNNRIGVEFLRENRELLNC